MTATPVTRVSSLTMEELAAALGAGRWLLLPFGTVEAHGPHLALGADLIDASRICGAVAERVGGAGRPGLPLRRLSHDAELPRHRVPVGCDFHGGRARGRPRVRPPRRATARSLLRTCRAGAARGAAGGGGSDRRRRACRRDPGGRPLRLPRPRARGGRADGPRRARGIPRNVDPARARSRRRAARPRPGRPRASAPVVFRVAAHPETEFPRAVRGDTSRVSPDLGQRAVEHVVAEFAALLERVARTGREW